MAAEYYVAETETGESFDDPSEDTLFDLICNLNQHDNTFITVEPSDTNEAAWYATVTVIDIGEYESVRRDEIHSQHDVTTCSDADSIAHDLTIWLAARRYRD